MVEITNNNGLEVWLKDHSRDEAVLIATRSALRVLPMLSKSIHSRMLEDSELTLQTFRALTASVLHLRTPTPSERLRKATFTAGQFLSRTAIYATNSSPGVHIAAAASAGLSALTAFSVEHDGAVGRAVSTVNACAKAANEGDIFRSVSGDCSLLDLRRSREPLHSLPIWKPELPEWARSNWHQLRDYLLDADEGWKVWTDWYQDQLDGETGNEALELAKALIPNEIWQAGPATLNAEIARLIAEHEGTTASRSTQTALKDLSAKDSVVEHVISSRVRIAAQTADLHDRVEAEISAQRERRTNDPLATENIDFLEGLRGEIADLSDTVNALPADPSSNDADETVERAWSLRDKIEDYAGWIAGEEHARQIANGTLIGGMVTLLISFGWSPLPLTAAAVALIGGPKLKAHLSDLIKQMRGS